jgi:hypothetical protein
MRLAFRMEAQAHKMWGRHALCGGDKKQIPPLRFASVGMTDLWLDRQRLQE